ncbi:MAG TPA: hypothetical protein VFR71_02970 [Methyloceanibacter sp.]|nr:hypothetical protein [Methyloceanibacter sp.]
MTRDDARTPLVRPLRVDDIKDDTSGEVAATPAEMSSIAQMLDLLALDRLALNYQLARGVEGRLHLSGR